MEGVRGGEGEDVTAAIFPSHRLSASQAAAGILQLDIGHGMPDIDGKRHLPMVGPGSGDPQNYWPGRVSKIPAPPHSRPSHTDPDNVDLFPKLYVLATSNHFCFKSTYLDFESCTAQKRALRPIAPMPEVGFTSTNIIYMNV